MYGKRGYSKRGARKYVRKGRKTVSKRTISKVVKNILKTRVEQKSWFGYQLANSVPTAATGIPYNVNLLPNGMTQGVQASQRIGNSIKVKSAKIEGYVGLLPYNSITNPLSTPVMVIIYILKCKQINASNLGSTSINSTLFNVNNSAVGFQANLLDSLLTINTDVWTVYARKTYKIGAASATTAGKVGTGGYYDNSPMTVHFNFNYGRHLKAQLKWDDAGNIQNNNMFMVCQPVYADGTNSAVTIAQLSYSLSIKYTDM